MKRLFPILGLFFLLASCSPYYTEGDYFFVRNNGADMPVWVKGQTDSDTAIIYLHGGPGDGCIHFSLVPQSFIEDNYMVVYWDQRHAGQAQGNPDIGASRMEDYISDTDLVIEAVTLRYNPSKIFLMGNSWGTSVGAAYLVHGDSYQVRQDKITGLISTFGTCDYTLSYENAAPRILTYAEERITQGIETEYWTECVSFYETTPVLLTVSDLRSHTGYVIASGGYTVADSASPPPDLNMVSFILASPVAMFPLIMTNGANDTNEEFIQWLVSDDSLSFELSRLSVPSIIISGRQDLQATWQAGLSLFLGTRDIEVASPGYATSMPTGGWSNGNRIFMILESTAHGSFGTTEDIEIYQNGIISFIESE